MSKKVTNSQQRLHELMDYYHINQTELCNKTGLQKSALSNYLNGDREPRQNQISLIADPFNINPAWLMGYDAPMFNEPTDTEKSAIIRELYNNFTEEQLNNPETASQIMEFVNLALKVNPDVRAGLLQTLKGLSS